jgi:WD40 repeat protein
VLQLWDAAAGRPVATLAFPGASPPRLAFSPDGATLAVAADSSLCLWDVAAARGDAVPPRNVVKLPVRFNGRLVFAPAGDCLAVCLAEKELEGPGECLLWDVKAGKERARLGGHQGLVWGLAFSPDGRTLATAGVRDGVVRVWDVATGQARAALVGHTVPVFDLAFRGDGRALVSAGGTFGLGDNVFKRAEVKVWDAGAWEALDAFATGSTWSPWALAPDGRTLAVCESPPRAPFKPRAVQLYDLATGQRRARLEGQMYAAFAPDGRSVATAPEKEPVVTLWDADTGARRASRTVPGGPVSQLEFGGDGRALLACFASWSTLQPRLPPRDQQGATAVMLGADDLAERARCAGAWGPAQLSADGAALAAYGPGSVLRVFDATTGDVRASFPREDRAGHGPEPFALSPDGRTLAVAGGPAQDMAAQVVRLFDVDGGREQVALRGDVRGLLCLAFSPDGATLATGHGGGFGVGWVKLWDAATGEERATLWGHRSAVESLRFMPDGRRLLSAGPAEVKFWDPVIGQEVLTLPGGSGLQLTRDGRLLAVGPSRESGGRGRLWRVP